MGEVELPSWLKALPQAPEFHPTEAEFADPVAYILKLEDEANQYGICKIVPPFTKASKKVVVNNLNRSLALSSGSLSATVHGSCGPLSRNMGGDMVGPQLVKPKSLCLDASCAESGSKAKFATRRQQLGWNPKRARGAHSQNHKLVWQSGESYTLEQFETKAKMFSRSRLGTCKDVSPLSVESLFWRAAAEKPISVEYANDIPGSAFAEPADSFSLTPMRLKKRKRALDDADQRNLDSIITGCRSDEKFQEEDVQATIEEFDPSDAGKPRNGGPEAGGDNAGGAGSKLANSAWNMRNVARSQGSLLRYMPEEVPGVTSPMVYIGMLFSWFAWHVEDHELHSLNYLHMGASKTWYAVPGDAAPALEEAIRVHGYGGHLNPRAAFSLLGEKTTVMSPEVLVAAGVPCCRLVQNAGEYVVTFPRAYHLGFSHGFNCGEAANFATPGWLAVAKEAAARRAAMNYLPMLSHQQLLYLLAMSLPLRIPASAPSEPRSSRLKVRKRSLGEEMVKSTFLHDVVHNNQLLCILLDNGVSRCLQAKDAAVCLPTTAMFEDSNQRSFVPPLGPVESPVHLLEPKFSSQGGESPDFSSQGVSGGEKTEDYHFQNELPRCAPVLSTLHHAILEESSGGKCGQIKHSLTDPSASTTMPTMSANEQAPQKVEANPTPLESHKVAVSLAIDWGTLPCAACGILCYATMAVVEPTTTAAMTFKPIYAAAGLGHCSFEAEDAGRMTARLPTFPSPTCTAVVEARHTNKLVSAFQPAYTNGAIKENVQGSMLAEFLDSTSRLPAVREVVVEEQTQPTDHGYLSPQLTIKALEEVQGSMDTSAASHYDGKQEARHLRHPTVQISDVGVGMVTTLVNTEQSPSVDTHGIQCLQKTHEEVIPEELGVCIVIDVDCNSDLRTAMLDANISQSGNLDGNVACGDIKETYHAVSPSHALVIPHTPVSICQMADSQITPCIDLQSQRCSPQSLNANDCTRIERCLDVAEIYCDQEKQKGLLSIVEHGKSNGPGLSSLQLLASNYDESSDVEDKNMFQAADICSGSLVENETIVDDDDDDDDGGEVRGKPHSGVGDFLTDIIGLSSDAPWSVLIPVTETTDVPPPTTNSPLFTFSSLVEGPNSLESIFISAGFSFVEEDDTADPASLGSSLTEEQLGKQSSEVTSFDGGLNNPSSYVQSGGNGKVLDMQELYHRINCQALTVDSDGDEQMLIHFGLRPLRAGVPQESLHVEESKSTNAGQVAGVPQESLHFEDSKSAGQVAKDCMKESATPFLPERKPAASRACTSVARPRVLCLEHAVEAQQQLRSVGGAHVIIVCHSDFENYELRAKHLTQEFGIEHTWRHVPFSSEGVDEEVSMVSTAVDVEDDESRKVNDWVMQMGLFVHHRFREGESESSDDTQNVSEDFRAGPFHRGKPCKPAGSRFVGGRSGLLHNSDGLRRSYSGSSSQMTTWDSRRLEKTSKKKKCMVAGRWCGRVWRVNQVHPFLGGCRKVDPSLQLGMSSTSLYALSVMSECDGGKYRKGVSSSRMEASPNGFIIPVKSTEDYQSIAVRNRGRKRKALEQGRYIQSDNRSDGQREMVTMSTDCPQDTLAVCSVGLQNRDSSSSPKHETQTESPNGPKRVDFTFNGGKEIFTQRDHQARCMMQAFSHTAHQPDPAVQVSKADFNCPAEQMISPIPLAARDPSEAVDKSNRLSLESKEPLGDQQLRTEVLLGQSECSVSADKMSSILSKSLPVPSESHQVADVKAFEFNLIPSPLPLSSIQIEPRQGEHEVGGWQKTASLTNVYSSLPLIGRAAKANNGSKRSLVASSNSTDGNKISATCNMASCVWRDVPVACAPSFHRFTAPIAGQFTDQFAHAAFSNSNHNHMYIPYISSASDHTLVTQSSHTKLYGGASNTFATFEQGEAKLQGLHLMQGKIEGQVLEAKAHEADPIQECPKLSTKCSIGEPLLYTELGPAVQHLGPTSLLGVKRKRDKHITTVYLGDNTMEADDMSLPDREQGCAQEHPLGNILPLRSSSRGRSAVKARGKRPKHVGWTNYKPAHPEIPGQIHLNAWPDKPHSHAIVPSIFTLQPEECVEARFEVEDCDRVLEIIDRSTGPTSPIPSLGLQGLTANVHESKEENGQPEKVVVKPKKKAKPKKKRVPTRKPAQEDGEFQCDLDGCRMSFATDAELQIHKRNRCTFKGCGKRFFMHKYLLQHRRVHLDERPLKCPWKGCKQAFKWAWARTEHIRVHTGERPYACPDCDQTFRFVSDFSRHKRNTGHTKS